MTMINDLKGNEIKKIYEIFLKKYEDYRLENLNLDMSRGKPCNQQLDLSKALLSGGETDNDYLAEGDIDIRNYGGLDGIPEAKKLFSEMLEVAPDEIIIGANSSLNMMYNVIGMAILHGEYNSEKPWKDLPKVRFLCPSPGYDRHFAICEHFNIEMITIEMTNTGPDMGKVMKLVAEDDSVKGIWCVPKYSNPDGITYSDETVEKLASMKTAAKDFRIYWDNAYAHHHLNENHDKLKNIFTACKSSDYPDRVYIFGSTSKITFAGAGVAMMGSGVNNRKNYLKHLAIQTIGPDKVNQLRHVRFLRDMDNINEHMKKQGDILSPKFSVVLKILKDELGNEELASWTEPNGGYFISLNTMDGCAKEVVKMAKGAGVILTNVGATFPYGNDPRDRNIRIAPSYPPVEELKKAIEIVALCVKIVSMQKLYPNDIH